MRVREAAKVRNRQTTWYVQSESDALVEYIVHNKRNVVSHHRVWSCNCPDFTERKFFTGGTCKHIDEVHTFVLNKQRTELAKSTDVKALIAQIVTVLKGPRVEAKQLWDILTALRGPDDDNSSLKEVTTATIRAAIGLAQNNVGAIVNPAKPFGADYTDYTVDYRLLNELRADYKASHHFVSHYRAAVQALKQLGYIK